MPDPLGLRIGGRYRLERRLARGRGAELYLAERKGRAYALKLLDPGTHATGSSLRHRYVVPVHEVDLDRTTERLYVVMDLVEGYPLSDLIRQGPLSVPRATRLMRQALQALEAAHAQGLVHGHLSPGKILVLGAGAPEEEVRLLGFGLASEVGLTRPAEPGFAEQVEELRKRIRRRDRRLQTTVRLPPPRRPVVNQRSPVGAMLYAAPELLLERPFDHRADLYSIAAILYELLSGRPPIEPSPRAEDQEQDLRLAIEGRDPSPLHEEFANVPREVSEILLQSLSKAPGDRPRNARELRRSLRRALDRVPVNLGPVREPAAPPPLTVIPETAPAKPSLVIRPQDLGATGGRGPTSVRLLFAASLGCAILSLLFIASLSGTRDPFLPVEHPRDRPAWSGSATVMNPPKGVVTWTRELEVYQAHKDGSHLAPVGSPTLVFMGRHEVTWGQYLRYCEQEKVQPPLGAGAPLAPVTSVTLAEAADYCAWAGGRLPTEEEFRAAAGEARDLSTKPVLREVLDSARRKDPQGTYDLRANADEWLASGMVGTANGVVTPPPDAPQRDPQRGFRVVIDLEASEEQ
jgi:serine/threonine protein kinase